MRIGNNRIDGIKIMPPFYLCLKSLRPEQTAIGTNGALCFLPFRVMPNPDRLFANFMIKLKANDFGD